MVNHQMLTLIHIQHGNATISVVHNGIIENYMRLREWLTGKGYEFLI